jgi:copper chaperone CopZ
MMSDKLSIGVQKEFCTECALGLRRFLEHMEGVEDVVAGDGKIEISYDGRKISEAELFRISRETVEKLGYRLQE